MDAALTWGRLQGGHNKAAFALATEPAKLKAEHETMEAQAAEAEHETAQALQHAKMLARRAAEMKFAALKAHTALFWHAPEVHWGPELSQSDGFPLQDPPEVPCGPKAF